jgi:nucleoside-diphosphate kinase
MEKTFAMVKPNGIRHGLLGRIVSRYEASGLAVLAIRVVEMTRAQAEGFYAEHQRKGFFEELVGFMSSGPVALLVLGGPNAVASVRALNGATNPENAAPGTIRYDFAPNTGMNVVHSSDSVGSAEREISYWFKAEEVTQYQISRQIAL